LRHWILLGAAGHDASNVLVVGLSRLIEQFRSMQSVPGGKPGDIVERNRPDGPWHVRPDPEGV